MDSRFFLAAGAFSGFLSVLFGAFGAHLLKDRLDAYHFGIFQLGTQYQMYHALALLAVGLTAIVSKRQLPIPGYCFLGGTIVFSGSLYLLALTGVKMWGAVTPIGGVALLVGWVSLAYFFVQR